MSRLLLVIAIVGAASLGLAWQRSTPAPTPASSGAPGASITAVRVGKLWDGTKSANGAVLLIDHGTFTSVGGGVSIPKGATELDLRRYTVIPGLIDLHTHITYYWDGAPGTTPLTQRVRRTPAETAKLAAASAMKTLETGVTTIRDLGSSGGTDYIMRDAIKAGTMVGPRMFVAGQGIQAGRGGPNPDRMRQQAEARVQAGSDWVKLYGSRGSFQDVDTTQTVTYDEMKAVVDTAHALGHKVAIHSYGASGVHDAVHAGADSVEHGVDLDDATIAEMVARGTVWVPTIDHNQYYIDARAEYGWGPEVVPPLQDYIQRNLASARRAVKAGVKIGMGSDAVYTMFGRNTGELAWLVKAGMTPAQALGAATTTAADLLGQADTLGRIAPGFAADLVAIDGDPLTNIQTAISGVRLVMKDGTIVVDKRVR